MVHEDWRHKAVPAHRTHPAGESMPGAMCLVFSQNYFYSQNSVEEVEH